MCVANPPPRESRSDACFLSLELAWLEFNKDVVKTSGAERQSGGQLGHGFEPIHIQGCRQNHVKKSMISRVFNTGLDPFTYYDVVKTTFQKPASPMLTSTVWTPV